MTTTPNRRDELGTFLNDAGLKGRMVEVGCAHGGFARIVLKTWAGKQLFLVDLWSKQDPNVYRERTNETANFEEWYEGCKTLQREDDRVTLVRLESTKAASMFGDEVFDCVYIDANHAGEAVVLDLNAWYPKVKVGGLFGGHDYCEGYSDGHWCGVKPAVEKWMGDKAFTVTDCSSWWHRKP